MSISTSIFDAALSTLLAIKNYLGTDGHENSEPVHDDARDLDADDFNRLVAGLAEVVVRMKAGRALTPTTVKTGDYAAAFGELVRVDCSAADRTVSLPATTADHVGYVIAVQLFAVAGGHTIHVDPNGTELINGLGAGNPMDITTDWQTVILTCCAAGVWSGLRTT